MMARVCWASRIVRVTDELGTRVALSTAALKGVEAMNQKNRDHLEQRLLQERQRAVKALRQLDSGDSEDGDLTTYPFHLADEGTDTMEQEKEFLLKSVEGRLVTDIDESLRTLYKEPERYGKCINCNSDIVFERLDLVPWVKLCLECQTIEEAKPVEAA